MKGPDMGSDSTDNTREILFCEENEFKNQEVVVILVLIV